MGVASSSRTLIGTGFLIEKHERTLRAIRRKRERRTTVMHPSWIRVTEIASVIPSKA